jgi:hypothetical protein
LLRGEQGTSWYYSGWHGDVKGKIKKLIAYSPIHLELPGEIFMGSVAVVAPMTEVELCGHATLASAHVLWKDGIELADRTIRFFTFENPCWSRKPVASPLLIP